MIVFAEAAYYSYNRSLNCLKKNISINNVTGKFVTFIVYVLYKDSSKALPIIAIRRGEESRRGLGRPVPLPKFLSCT
jgi:predicted acetyltransferase